MLSNFINFNELIIIMYCKSLIKNVIPFLLTFSVGTIFSPLFNSSKINVEQLPPEVKHIYSNPPNFVNCNNGYAILIQKRAEITAWLQVNELPKSGKELEEKSQIRKIKKTEKTE